MPLQLFVVAILMALFVLTAVIVGLFVFSKPDISGKREESDYADYHTDENGNKYGWGLVLDYIGIDWRQQGRQQTLDEYMERIINE